ncbi:MAG: ABC transporter ATP-binding protein [Thermoprotei archaeon]|nr:MAG: ABC transporter ATP-binding protein [Thermoprotei archaeon]
MPGENLILSIRNLNVVYWARRGWVKAVRNVSLDIYRGEVLGLVGESGSGKTTLALTVMKLLPTNAKILSGSILYYGLGKAVDLAKLSEKEIRKYRWKEIALAFQGAMNAFNPVMRIKDHFIETAKAHLGHVDEEEVLKEARELLKLVLLEPDRVLRSFPHQLSGGMKQRTLLALALLLRPKLIILDEPTSALDVVSQKVILETLRNIKREFSTTMILITHDLSIAAELTDRVAIMYAGKIMEVGGVEDIFYDPMHPYTRGLLKAVPVLKGTKEVESIPGSPPDLIDLPPGCAFHPRCPYAMERCRREDPPLVEVKPGRFVACWLYTKR